MPVDTGRHPRQGDAGRIVIGKNIVPLHAENLRKRLAAVGLVLSCRRLGDRVVRGIAIAVKR